MEKLTQRVSLGSNGQAIVVSNSTFDADGFGDGQTAGLIQIQPGRDPIEMWRKAANFKWDLSGNRSIQGFVSNVVKGRELTEEERSRQILSGRSITNILDADATDDVVHSGETSPASRVAAPLV